DGNAVRAQSIENAPVVTGPGPTIGVGVGGASIGRGVGIGTGVGVGVPVGEGPSRIEGSTFATFPLDQVGPPPWRLHVKLAGFAQVMRQKVVRIRARGDDVAGLSGTDREMLIDTCGTGGDATGTFNVSTATAFVVAGAGLRVAKHGNRSVSSLCGSADVVETLGINLELTPQKVGRCIDEVGLGFLYAPLLHTAMKHVMA